MVAMLLVSTAMLQSVLVTDTACRRRATTTSRVRVCSLPNVPTKWARPMLLNVVLILLTIQNGSGWVAKTVNSSVSVASECLLLDRRSSRPMCPLVGSVLISMLAASTLLGPLRCSCLALFGNSAVNTRLNVLVALLNVDPNIRITAELRLPTSRTKLLCDPIILPCRLPRHPPCLLSVLNLLAVKGPTPLSVVRLW